MRPLLIILACGVFSLGGYRNACSQSPGASPREDRPSQRWLPLPKGGQGNIADQVRLLELLRSQIASASDQPPMPELTEAQLRELDKAYQAWTEQSGGAQLPDWNSIPKAWVDKAMANPEQLKQAQRLIEQYARQRKLPLPEAFPSQPQSAIPQNSKPLRSTLQVPSSQTQDSLPQSSKSRSSKPNRTELPNTELLPNTASQNAESQNAESQNAESQSSHAQSRDVQSGPNPQAARATTGARARAGLASPGSARGAPANSDNAKASDASQESKAASALKPTLAENTASKSLTSLAPDAAGKQLLHQPNGLSDAARFNALRDFLDKLKTVQASRSSRDLQSGSSDRSTDGTGRRNSTRMPEPKRAANAEGSGADTFNRNARKAAAAASTPVPRTAGAQPLARAAVQTRSATDRRTNAEVLNRPNKHERQTENGAEGPRDQEVASDDQSEVPASQANGSVENGTFYVPPMLQSSATDLRGSSDRVDPSGLRNSSLQSSGLRTAARSSATERASSQRSSSEGFTADPSGHFRASEAPATSSAPRSVRIPKIASEVSAGLSSSQAEIQAKIQHDIQQFGWHTTLRRIIADTFKEEAGAGGQPQAKTPIESSAGNKPAETKPNAPRKVNLDLTAARQSMPDALSNSRLTSVLADVWKAIATAPPTENKASSSSLPSSGDWRKWKWNGKYDHSGNELPIVLLIVAAVCLAVWVSRKRPAFLRSDRALDTRWAKEVLAEGIRTRADVIRVFHRFVSQTAEPVASWWTHRYVTRRLVESTPQLSAAMFDLSSVYEQARYMPPEAELSAEQISRVYGALRECAAYGSSTANVST